MFCSCAQDDSNLSQLKINYKTKNQSVANPPYSLCLNDPMEMYVLAMRTGKLKLYCIGQRNINSLY